MLAMKGSERMGQPGRVLLALEYGWNAVYFGAGQVNGKPDSIRHGC